MEPTRSSPIILFNQWMWRTCVESTALVNFTPRQLGQRPAVTVRPMTQAVGPGRCHHVALFRERHRVKVFVSSFVSGVQQGQDLPRNVWVFTPKRRGDTYWFGGASDFFLRGNSRRHLGVGAKPRHAITVAGFRCCEPASRISASTIRERQPSSCLLSGSPLKR